jgi:putative ubiquitin-RnfH superfamily antitoxin RatB of RatAB toxin-antitoxin module
VKRCTVVFALPQRQWLWEIAAPDSATVGEVLARARAAARDTEIPWDAEVGIFGVPCDTNAVPRDGDRIEIYRPLRADPKESRRARAKAARAARDSAARPPSIRSRS